MSFAQIYYYPFPPPGVLPLRSADRLRLPRQVRPRVGQLRQGGVIRLQGAHSRSQVRRILAVSVWGRRQRGRTVSANSLGRQVSQGS